MKKDNYNKQQRTNGLFKVKTTLKALSLLLALVSSNLLIAQNADYEWATSFTGSEYGFAFSVCSDAAGNVYTTGGFLGTVDFDPGAGTTSLTSAGSTDIYVTKQDAAGNLIWAKSFPGTNNNNGRGIAVDAAGNVYTTGGFRGSVDFDPGAGVNNQTANGFSAIFILKLNASGDLAWVKNIGGTSGGSGYGIALDAAGNIYTTGEYGGTVDFDPGAGTTNLTGGGIFTLKLNAAGNFVWANGSGQGSGSTAGEGITVDNTGNVYTAGRFSGTVDFDATVGVGELTSNGSVDAFITKFDATGNFVWARNFGASSYDVAKGIALDGLGNVILSGHFQETTDFDPGTGTVNLVSNGNYDVFIVKLDLSGNYVWAKSFGGTSGETGNGIYSDALGNIYTTGGFQGTIDFDPGAGTSNLASTGSSDIFISKLNTSGDFVWAKKVGGPNNDVSYSIVEDGMGNIFISGVFSNTVDFDPGTGTSNLTATGIYDQFVLKLSCRPSTGKHRVTACVSYIFNDITYTSNNNTAMDTLVNASGCDSFVTLDLTINAVDISTASAGNTITANATGSSFQWIDCSSGTIISNAVDASYTATTNGDYAVIVTTGDCSDTSDCVNIATAGIKDRNRVTNAYPLYPNPTTSLVTIANFKSTIEQVTVLDITGKTLQSFTPTSAVIDMSMLPKGIYFVTLKDGESTSTQKVIKH